MSFPETPLLIYPSLAKRYGVEVSLLYGICYQLFRDYLLDNQESEQVIIPLKKWLSVTDVWQSDELHVLSQSMAEQQLFLVKYHHNEVCLTKLAVKASTHSEGLSVHGNNTEKTVNVDAARQHSQPNQYPHESNKQEPAQHFEPDLTADETMQVLPVYDVPPAPPARSLPKRRDTVAFTDNSHSVNNSANSVATNGNSSVTNNGNTLKNKGPAPSFGGSTGWKKRSNDALQNIFEQQEVLNRQLQGMTMNWRPSKMFYKTLERNNISQEFADSYLDEFILFYCDKFKKESIGGWDQKYLAWVKRAWVQKQSKPQTSDSSENNSAKKTGFSNENSQRDTREKRKRITAAIMDIHDTNW